MIRLIENNGRYEDFFEQVKDLYLSIFPNGSCFYEHGKVYDFDDDDGEDDVNMFKFFYGNYSSLEEANRANDTFQVEVSVYKSLKDSDVPTILCYRHYVKKMGVYGNQTYHWVKSPKFNLTFGEKECLSTLNRFFNNLKKTTEKIGWEV